MQTKAVSRHRLLQAWVHRDGVIHIPTLTDGLLSSSEALLPPLCLLDMLVRLELLGARSNALSGRCGRADGEVGGELAISLDIASGQQNVSGTQRR